MAILKACIVATVLAGCGLDPFGEAGGGADDLPTAGAGPYARFASDDSTPADEPFVLFDPNAELFAPAVLPGGPGLRIWMSREVPGTPDDTQIYYGEVASPHDVPSSPPSLALAADQPWEQGRVGAPSVVDLGGKHLVMFYEAGTTSPVIGRADSTDDGATWTKVGAPVLADAQAPSAAFVHGAFHLFAVRTGSPDIWHATANDAAGDSFAFTSAPVMEPRPGVTKAYDADHLDEPCVVVETEQTGTVHWGLYAVGFASAPSDAGSGTPGIGYAASFDGDTWERFGGAAAQLSPTATGPAVLLTPAHGLMLYTDVKRGLRAIAAAHNP